MPSLFNLLPITSPTPGTFVTLNFRCPFLTNLLCFSDLAMATGVCSSSCCVCEMQGRKGYLVWCGGWYSVLHWNNDGLVAIL